MTRMSIYLALFLQMQFSELFEGPATYETVAKILGYPEVDVNPEQRGTQCSNCGSHDHTYEDCKLPKMDELLLSFGSSCYDVTPAAVEAKRIFVSELSQGE